jgi:hypothetical protein
MLRSVSRFHDQRAAHVAAAILRPKVAVEGEGTRPVGKELEGDRVARAGPLGDPVGVHRHAVRDVIGVELDPDQIILEYLDSRGVEPVAMRTDREGASRRPLVLRGQGEGGERANGENKTARRVRHDPH